MGCWRFSQPAPALFAQGPAQAAAEDALTVKARGLLAAMDKGDFQLAARDFDETMLKVSGPDKLEPMWTKQLPAQLGAFKKQAGARREQLQGYEIVLITCEFEKATLDARVVFDKAGKIAGLGFVPTAPPVKYEPPAYADAAKFVESEVTVGSGEWALPGTLTMPKGAGPFPALVLVHGSGPNDRDETLGPNKPFKDLAWGLASRGIAVLRYDKRSKVHGNEDPGRRQARSDDDRQGRDDRRRRGRGGLASKSEGHRSEAGLHPRPQPGRIPHAADRARGRVPGRRRIHQPWPA